MAPTIGRALNEVRDPERGFVDAISVAELGAGVSELSIVAASLLSSEPRPSIADFAAFTRAEEVGLLGAWHLGKHWPFGKDAVFLSIYSAPKIGYEKANP